MTDHEMGATERVTVTVPAGQREAFEHLWREFQAGKVRVSTPPMGFAGQSYKGAVASVFADSGTGYVLRRRIGEDASRDPDVAIADAEVLLALQTIRFNESPARGAPLHDEPDQIERAGVQALKRLYHVACGDTGQSGRVARFLLALYNGHRFPFDLTDLRAIDDSLFDDCMRVLVMDARISRREVHAYFDAGGHKWEAMAQDWRVPDAHRLHCIARSVIRDGLSNFGGRLDGGQVDGLIEQLREAMKTPDGSQD